MTASKNLIRLVNNSTPLGSFCFRKTVISTSMLVNTSSVLISQRSHHSKFKSSSKSGLTMLGNFEANCDIAGLSSLKILFMSNTCAISFNVSFPKSILF
jgi:hypothetical protein